jgi:hypothetical protein
MLSAYFTLFLTVSAALTSRHHLPAPRRYRIPAFHTMSSRNCVMVDAILRYSGFTLQLFEFVGLIDDFWHISAP